MTTVSPERAGHATTSGPGRPDVSTHSVRRVARRVHALLAYADEVVTVSDADGLLVYVSPSASRVLGYDPDELAALGSLLPIVHAADAPRVHAALRRATAAPGTTVSSAFRARGRDSSVLDLEASITSLLHDPAVEGVIVGLRDVTERRRAERALAHDALHDPLTSLPNRTLFLDRLRQALRRRARGGDHVVVLFVDLDRFKVVNDTLGHAAGDEVLVEVGRRLSEAMAPGDTVARLGGDEFVVLCMVPEGGGSAAEMAEYALEALSGSLRLPEGEVCVTASVGAVVADAYQEADELLADADAAMYTAKELGRDRVEVFDPHLHQRAGGRLTTEHALRRALEDRELRLVYQPAFDLRTRAIVGVEALVRWRHPERGLVAPGEFVPLAEETGLILPLGAWVLEEACEVVSRWPVGAGSERRIWVNLAAQQLADPELLVTIRRVLDRTGLSPDRLGLELTETALMHEADPAVAVLSSLRALGVAFALDDFGTGYSSLTYLHRFPVDVLKVDRSFVVNLAQDTRTATIVKGVTEMAHALGMVVVAEGVEVASQLSALRSAGCDVAQGHFLMPPVPAETLDEVFAFTR